MEALNSGKNSVVTQNPIAVPQKKVVWGGKEALLLEKTNKSSPAQAGCPLQSQGAAVQGLDGCSPSQSIMGQQPSIPPSPSAGIDLHSLYPCPCISALARPSKTPQNPLGSVQGRAVGPCWDGHHGGGTCCILAFSWERSDFFRRKIESLSWNTPGVSHEPWVEGRKQLS